MKTIIFINICFLNKRSKKIEMIFESVLIIFIIGSIIKNKVYLDFASNFVEICILS